MVRSGAMRLQLPRASELLHAAALMGFGLTGRPDRAKQLRATQMMSTPCGVGPFEILDHGSTLGDAKSVFTAHCQEVFEADRCNSTAAELWKSYDLTQIIPERTSEFCTSLRFAIAAAGRTALLGQSGTRALLDEAAATKDVSSSQQQQQHLQQEQQQEQQQDEHQLHQELQQSEQQREQEMEREMAEIPWDPRPARDWPNKMCSFTVSRKFNFGNSPFYARHLCKEECYKSRCNFFAVYKNTYCYLWSHCGRLRRVDGAHTYVTSSYLRSNYWEVRMMH